MSERCHVLLMLEERTEGEELSYYSWDADKSYDLSLIFQFELEYQRQEDNWPTDCYNRLWPGDIEAIWYGATAPYQICLEST